MNKLAKSTRDLIAQQVDRRMEEIGALISGPPDQLQIKIFSKWGYQDPQNEADQLNKEVAEFINSEDCGEVVDHKISCSVATHEPNQMCLDTGDNPIYMITIAVTYT